MINNAHKLSPGDTITHLVDGSERLDYKYRVEEVLGKYSVLGQVIEIDTSYTQSTRDHFLSAPREISFDGESEWCSVLKVHYSTEDFIS